MSLVLRFCLLIICWLFCVMLGYVEFWLVVMSVLVCVDVFVCYDGLLFGVIIV